MLTILSVIKRAVFQLSSTIITQVGLFDYVIYSSADAHCWQCDSAGTQQNKPTLPIMILETESGSLNGVKGDHDSSGLEGNRKICAT